MPGRAPNDRTGRRVNGRLRPAAAPATTTDGPDAALAELIDRVLDRGVVVKGDLVVSVAGVDLLYVGLDVVLSSVEALRRLAEPPGAGTSEG